MEKLVAEDKKHADDDPLDLVREMTLLSTSTSYGTNKAINDDSSKLVQVKYYNKPCIYEYCDDKEHDYEYTDLFMEVSPKDFIPFQEHCDIIFFKNDDLPMHWRYLQSCIALKKCPTKRDPAELFVVEKYKNVAIAYDYTYVRQPVVIYRHCCVFFKKLKVGSTFKGQIFKLFVPQAEQPTVVLSDLYCKINKVGKPSNKIQFKPSSTNVTITKFLIQADIERKNLIKYKTAHVLFSDFGAVFIPPEYVHLLSIKNAEILGSIEFRLRGIEPDLYACWELQNEFLVFVRRRIFSYCKFGSYHQVEEVKKRRRFAVDTGEKVIQYGKPQFKKEKQIVFKKVNIDCIDLDDFIVYNQMKPTRFR